MERLALAVVLALGIVSVVPAQTTYKAVLTWTDTLNLTGTTHRVYRALGLWVAGLVEPMWPED
jgi:hypothetical protein